MKITKRDFLQGLAIFAVGGIATVSMPKAFIAEPVAAATTTFIRSTIENNQTFSVVYKGCITVDELETVNNLQTGHLYRITKGGNYYGRDINVGDFVIWSGEDWDIIDQSREIVPTGNGITVTACGDTNYSQK